MAALHLRSRGTNECQDVVFRAFAVRRVAVGLQAHAPTIAGHSFGSLGLSSLFECHESDVCGADICWYSKWKAGEGNRQLRVLGKVAGSKHKRLYITSGNSNGLPDEVVLGPHSGELRNDPGELFPFF